MSGSKALALGDAARALALAEQAGALETPSLLRFVIDDLFAERIALVSSFGADSAALLHMVAQIDRNLPVLFIDTLHMFAETLAYRDELIGLCGLTNVITIGPDADQIARQDPEKFLWAQDPDRCCAIRKAEPLARALRPYDAWITGRKRFQSATREALPLFERDGERIKVNPLARWTAADIDSYFARHDLPRHPLFGKGYLSIGCLPCTSPVRAGEAARAGRWRGKGKSECGIHVAPVEATADH